MIHYYVNGSYSTKGNKKEKQLSCFISHQLFALTRSGGICAALLDWRQYLGRKQGVSIAKMDYGNYKITYMSPESSVGIATRFKAGRPAFGSRQCKIFLFSAASIPILGPIQPPNQWVPGALSPDHSPPSNAKIKNGGAILPIPSHVFMEQCLTN
jgi:hypothetical protein